MPRGEEILTDDPVPHFDGSDNSVSTSVLERAKLGDQDAFRMITQLYAGLVYHWIRKRGLSPEHTEDVSQQVFMAVIHNLKTFQRTKPADSFRAWIRTITRSKIVDHIRKNTGVEIAFGGDKSLNEVATIENDDEDEEDDRDSAILYQKAVQFVKGEFADKDCRAFLMLVVDGIPAKDVAQILGISVNSVYIAKSRILKRLQDEFADLIDGDTN
jgi:RNA polymerase sigma-70 factor (ECF subfamily)